MYVLYIDLHILLQPCYAYIYRIPQNNFHQRINTEKYFYLPKIRVLKMDHIEQL